MNYISFRKGCIPLEIKEYDTGTDTWKMVQYLKDTDNDTNTLKTNYRLIFYCTFCFVFGNYMQPNY